MARAHLNCIVPGSVRRVQSYSEGEGHAQEGIVTGSSIISLAHPDNTNSMIKAISGPKSSIVGQYLRHPHYPARMFGLLSKNMGSRHLRPEAIEVHPDKSGLTDERITCTSDDRPSSVAADAPGGGYRIALLVGLVVAAVVGATSGAASSLLEALQVLVEDSSLLGGAVFIILYALATVLLFPASVLTLAAGAFFGPVQGTMLVSVGSTLGATLAFLTSRYVARPLVEGRLSQNRKLQAVVNGVSSEGMKIVFLLRLSPLFPFNLLNYALGLTGISLWQYVIASWAGMLPGTIAYVFLGGAGRAAADAARSGSLQPAQLLLYFVGAAATLAVAKVAADAASRQLQAQERQE